MTVLVTGGAGYIGGQMALALLDAGASVLVLDDLSAGPRRAAPPGAELVPGSVGDAALLDRILRDRKVSEVMHFAALIHPGESLRRPLDYYRVNTGFTQTLLGACARAGVERFVLSSTAAVYGAAGMAPVGEEAPVLPVSPYGASKLMAERIVQDAARAHGLRFAILRYFNVAGRDPAGRWGPPDETATHLVNVACEAAVGKRARVDIHGGDYDTPDGTCIRDYIHVADLVGAHLAALAHLRRGGRNLLLNCGAGRGVSVREVLAAVERAAGVRLQVRMGPRRPGDPPALVADCTRIARFLHWHPRRSGMDEIAASALGGC